MAETRSPLKDKPLRNPGQSVRVQRIGILVDKLMLPLIFAAIALTLVLSEWARYLWPAQHMPWLQTALAFACLVFFVVQFRRYWPRVLALEQAEDGEKVVGQLLEGTRAMGYLVFHDLVGEGFNVDHVIIGPGGVYTIETKTWSKPAKGDAEICFDGETLTANGSAPDRNPVVQAKAQANWVQRVLLESTGRSYAVWPVVLFPGWFVRNSPDSFKELWVLAPKAFTKFLANEKPVLPPEDVSLAASHLSRFIVAEERRREAAN